MKSVPAPWTSVIMSAVVAAVVAFVVVRVAAPPTPASLPVDTLVSAKPAEGGKQAEPVGEYMLCFDIRDPGVAALGCGAEFDVRDIGHWGGAGWEIQRNPQRKMNFPAEVYRMYDEIGGRERILAVVPTLFSSTSQDPERKQRIAFFNVLYRK